MRQLDHFIEFAYFPRLKNDVRRQVSSSVFKHVLNEDRLTDLSHQLLWMMDRLTAANVANVEMLHFQLLRQVPAGDISPSTTTLCRQLVDLCETHRYAFVNLGMLSRRLHMAISDMFSDRG